MLSCDKRQLRLFSIDNSRMRESSLEQERVIINSERLTRMLVDRFINHDYLTEILSRVQQDNK
jgi:hypothetical protein